MAESQAFLDEQTPVSPGSTLGQAGPSSPAVAARSAAAEAAVARSSSGASPSQGQAQARLALAAEKRLILKIIDDDILGRNPRPQALDTLELLITLTTNALADPTKRSIRLGNPAIKRRIVEVQGAVNLLLKSYWAKKVDNYEEFLVFPSTPSVKQLEQLKLSNETLINRTAVIKEASDKSERNRKAAQLAEKQRTQQTLLAIRDDRLSNEARAERERLSRELKKEMAMKEAAQEESDRLAALEQPSGEGKKDR